jgi:hypothetical protein
MGMLARSVMGDPPEAIDASLDLPDVELAIWRLEWAAAGPSAHAPWRVGIGSMKHVPTAGGGLT